MSEAAAYRGAPPSTRLLDDVGMRVCLMIERQEDVTRQQWLALAEVCERGGFDGLFRSDRYLSVFGHEQRESLDAWTLAGTRESTQRSAVPSRCSAHAWRSWGSSSSS